MTQYQQTVSNQVTFTITEQDYQKSMWLHMKQKGWRVAVLICVVMVIFFGAVSGPVSAIGWGVFFALYMGFLGWMMRRNIRNIYRSMPQLHGEQTIQFNDEGLVWHNAYALSKVKWQLFQKFDADENLYLLYQGPHMFNLIPRSAFHSEAQEEAFRMMLEINVKPARAHKTKRVRS